MKADLIRESKSINNEINKRKKRYSSIILTDDDVADFENKLNSELKKHKKNHSKSSKKRESIKDIMIRRGIIPKPNENKNNLEKIYKSNKTDNEEDNSEVERNEDGVNFMIYNFKSD